MATAKGVLAAGEALAGENEAVVGSNNTTVNKYYNWIGAAYCGLFIRYCMEKAGCALLKGCANPAYVPTLRQFMDGQGWRVPNSAARPGDIVVEGSDQHVVFVHKVLGGGVVIFLEGNGGHVKATEAQAENGTGSTYEGIGYRRQALGSNHKVYRPPYDGAEPAAPVPVEPYGKVVFADVGLHELSKGCAGAEVKTIQRIIFARGIDRSLTVDGEFGPKTRAGVMALQKQLGLVQDGVVGKDTWKKALTALD